MTKNSQMSNVPPAGRHGKGQLSLSISWLYPDLMSTYGDRGNVICLVKRCQWRSISVKVEKIFLNTSPRVIKKCDLLFAGGAQDRQQKIVEKDLRENKGEVIKDLVERGTPGLYICAAYQLFGHRYQPAEGVDLEGLHIFDIETKHFGKEKPRCIGNIVAELPEDFFDSKLVSSKVTPPRSHLRHARGSFVTPQGGFIRRTIVGFENHGGRTYLGKKARPLARVLVGFGNNGEDGTDGLWYKNSIGNYFHGPILPKNPHLADWLIKRALEVKYKETIKLPPLDDTLEWQAHKAVLKKLKLL